MKNILIIVSFLVQSICFAQLEVKKYNDSVDSFVKQKIKELNIPGMAIAVIKNGKVLKKTTYGVANLDWNNKVTEHTNFQIASCTKLLTSALLLKTMYNGKINLEDPVSKYIDSIPTEWNDIKIKNLIAHSSGIPDYYDSGVFLSVPKVIELAKKSPLIFKPGTKEQYGGSDFVVLTYIFEKIYKKPFVQILHDEVTVPLQMQDGSFDMEFNVNGRYLRTNVIPEKITTYYDMGGKIQAYKYLYPQYTYSAGGYFASIDDMTNWAIGLDKEILFPRQFSEKYIYKSDKIGENYAGFSKAGWALQKEGAVVYGGHSGGPGLGDVIKFPKEGYTFIVLTNDGELLPGLARAIASIYIKELVPKLEIEKFERN